MKKKKGISLIVLIITIVVIVILAAAIILNLKDTNIIGNANEAVVKQDFKTFESELDLYIADKYVENLGRLDVTTIDAITIEEVVKYIPSIEGTKYEDEVIIEDGELKLKEDSTLTEKEKEWISEVLGNTVSSDTPSDSEESLNPSEPDDSDDTDDSNDIDDSELGKITASTVAKNATNYYGKSVTNYNPQNNSEVGWKIFHSDGTNIYLISDKYIEYAEIPSGKGGSTFTQNPEIGEYIVGLSEVVDDYSGTSDITDARLKKLNNDYFNVKGYSSDNTVTAAMAYLLDTNVWSTFNGLKADYVIGAPTIELLIDSYNAKNGTSIGYQASSELGYQIRATSSDAWTNKFSDIMDEEDKLYNPTCTNIYLFGSWVASPSSVEGEILGMFGDGIGDCGIGITLEWAQVDGKWYGYWDNAYGLRPVVCLNSSVELEEQNGTFIIKE